MFRHLSRTLCLGLLGLLTSSQVYAGISLSATRLVFDGAHKEASITVRNNGEDVLIQSWVDANETNGNSVPFAVTPPLVKIAGNDKQLLRIIYEGKGMPSTKESVVWLNVQEIPQTAKMENTLQLAVRQRIKIFFRPTDMKGDAFLAPTELAWRLITRNGKSILSVNNHGHYHVSIAELKLQSGQLAEAPIDSVMIAPGENKEFTLKKINAMNSTILTFRSINDYGAQDQYTGKLSRNSETRAKLETAAP